MEHRPLSKVLLCRYGFTPTALTLLLYNLPGGTVLAPKKLGGYTGLTLSYSWEFTTMDLGYANTDRTTAVTPVQR